LRRLIDNDYLTLVFRLALGGIFIYAAVYKIIEPAQFAKSIWYYHILPGKLINLAALVLPWLEAFIGLGIILGAYYRGAVLWANLLLIVFMGAVASAVYRGISIDCGCFKTAVASDSSAMTTIYRDIGYLVMGLQLLFSRSRKWMLANLSD
jgi:hypothetical protein